MSLPYKQQPSIFASMRLTLVIFVLALLYGCSKPTPNKKSRVYEPKDPQAQSKVQLDYLKKKSRQKDVDPAVFYHMARIYFQDKKFLLSKTNILKAIKSDSSNLAFVHLGLRVFNKLRDYESALLLCDKFFARSDLSSEMFEEMAWSYAMSDHTAQSLKCLGKAGYASNASSFVSGINFLNKEDTAQALNQFHKIYTQEPDIPELYKALASIYAQNKNIPMLKDVVQKYEHLYPKDTLIWKETARLFELQEKQALQLKVYKNILSRFPEHYEARALLARHYFNLGFNTNNHTIRRNLDTCLVYLNGMEGELKLRELKIKAQAYRKLRRYDESLEYYKKVMEIAPNDSLAQAEIPAIVGTINYLAKRRSLSADTTNND